MNFWTKVMMVLILVSIVTVLNFELLPLYVAGLDWANAPATSLEQAGFARRISQSLLAIVLVGTPIVLLTLAIVRKIEKS